MLDRRCLSGVFVERSDLPVGGDPDRVILRRFLNHNDHFVVLFEDTSLAYVLGTLYRDDAFAAGDDTCAIFKANVGLATATDEKGEFTTLQTRFDAIRCSE